VLDVVRVQGQRLQPGRQQRPLVRGVPMKPLVQRDPFKIGLIAIAGGVVIGLVILVLSVVTFGTDSYTAELEHTAGLRKGEDVQIHGVPVGRVTKIELSGEHVLVTFVVDGDIDLGSKTTAEVKVATLLGTHYLQVTPEGSGSLADGRIPLARTSVPYNLQDVLEGGTKNLEALDADKLAEALSAVSDTLSASSGDIKPALTGVARLSEVVTTRSSQVNELLKAARSVTDQLSASSDDIVGLMEQTRSPRSSARRRTTCGRRCRTSTVRWPRSTRRTTPSSTSST
jgi:phospholipid/cholesterol/gamma-HCH transport system substrate-binding protein